MKQNAILATLILSMQQIIVVLVFFLLTSVMPAGLHIMAQAPTAGAESIANCDLCGYCQGEKPPSNWEACRNCIYPALKDCGGRDCAPVDNKTLQGTGFVLPQSDQNRYYTMLGCLSSQPAEFAAGIARLLFSLVGGIAFLYLLYGAGIVATSQANPDRISQGRRIIYGAIVGLLFVLFATFILRFIAVDVLQIPGFGT